LIAFCLTPPAVAQEILFWISNSGWMLQGIVKPKFVGHRLTIDTSWNLAQIPVGQGRGISDFVGSIPTNQNDQLTFLNSADYLQHASTICSS
jgi:hypothetical protein